MWGKIKGRGTRCRGCGQRLFRSPRRLMPAGMLMPKPCRPFSHHRRSFVTILKCRGPQNRRTALQVVILSGASVILSEAKDLFDGYGSSPSVVGSEWQAAQPLIRAPHLKAFKPFPKREGVPPTGRTAQRRRSGLHVTMRAAGSLIQSWRISQGCASCKEASHCEPSNLCRP